MRRITTFLLCNFFLVTASPVPKFVSFGTDNGDTQMAPNDDGDSTLNLRSDLPFFGKKYNQLWIKNNGVISFTNGHTSYIPNCSSLPTPMISPFWTDIQTFPNDSGKVYYRQSQSSELLATLANEIRQTNSSQASLKLSSAIVVTWFNVSFYGVDNYGCLFLKNPDFWPRNTFQAIVATDGVQTYVIFNYHRILWVTGGSCGLNRTPAKIGFDSGNGKDFEVVAGSCTNNISTIVNKSNIGIPGKFIFHIDNNSIDLRLTTTKQFKVSTVRSRHSEVTAAVTKQQSVATTSTLRSRVATILPSVTKNSTQRAHVSTASSARLPMTLTPRPSVAVTSTQWSKIVTASTRRSPVTAASPQLASATTASTQRPPATTVSTRRSPVTISSEQTSTVSMISTKWLEETTNQTISKHDVTTALNTSIELVEPTNPILTTNNSTLGSHLRPNSNENSSDCVLPFPPYCISTVVLVVSLVVTTALLSVVILLCYLYRQRRIQRYELVAVTSC